MSVESTTLERSALERKARDELAIIAQHLGVKTRSRDRKAEIVAAILEKTGVEATMQEVPDNGDQGGAPVSQPPNDQNDREPTSAAEAQAPEAQPGSQQPPGGPPGQLSLHAEQKEEKVVDVRDQTQETDGAGTPAAPAASAASGPPAAPESPSASPGEGAGKENAAPATPDPAPAATASSEGAGGEASSEAASDQQKSNGTGRGAAHTDGQESQGQTDQKDQRDQKQDQRDQRQGGQRGQRNGQKGGQDSESGNRRRRRRGRNRAGGEGGQEEYTGEPVEVEGFLDLRDEGYGFLRLRGSRPSKEDIYVSVKQARQFGLRKGDHVNGGSRPALRNEKNPALLRIDLVNGDDPEQARKRRKFEDLTPLFPDEKLSLEMPDDPGNMTSRIIDLISPIGKGQRGLIVSPPKAGKTTIMKQIVRSIETNSPEVKLMVLLVDERPEEVTDMRRWLRNETSEVAASTFDRPSEEHTQVAELTIERAKRMVEQGEDVCIILDGITRLARAYNLAAPATGRIMSGGVDSGALYPPKKFFGAARNVEEGGSLTILATALIETGSKMDEVIFEEFKGTGNMELRLDRRLAERRIYPAIDVDASSTRHEELLFPRSQLNLVWALRRVLSGLSSSDGGNAASLELLIDRMKTFRANDEFLAEVAKNRLAAG